MADGEVDAALGAMLLFLTNFLAILLAGGGTLALLGLSAVTMKDLEREARGRAFILVALGVLLITIPLGAASIRVFEQNQIRRETIQLAQEWIEGTDYGISEVDVSGNQIDLVIFGSGERPQLSDLGDQLDASLDQLFTMNLVILPSDREEFVDVSE